MKYFLILTFALLASFAQAQDIRFRDSDQKIMVRKGQTVKVETDTAYIISKSRANALNEKLTELAQLRENYNTLQGSNRELISKLGEVQELVTRLMQQMEDDHRSVDVNLAAVTSELQSSIDALKENNEQLVSNNEQLEQKIEALNATIRKLKKEIRGIWWNGLADKLVVGLAGVGIGMLIVAL